MPTAAEARPASVVVIDDDADVREALRGLFRSVGLEVEPFASTQAFAASGRPDRPGCLVLDVRLPGQSGLDFQDQLLRARDRRPVIFISGHADVETSVRAMKAGAVEFFTKPVREQQLLDAVQRAIDIDAEHRMDEAAAREAAERHALLTPRERSVLDRVAAGLRNKAVAAELGISEATVKLHRANIMQKLGVETLVDLVRFADRLAAGPPAPTTKV